MADEVQTGKSGVSERTTEQTAQVTSPTHAPSATPSSATPSSASTMYGGQAVIEGVMMRSPHFFAVACRRANGEIVTTCEPVPKIFRPAWQKLPFLRGGFALVDSMTLGTKALYWAAKIAEQDTQKTSPSAAPSSSPEPMPPPAPKKEGSKVTDIAIGGAMVIGLLSSIFLFQILPHFGLEFLKRFGWANWQLSLAQFTLKFSLLTGYILLVSRMEYVYRVFQYHGAEHKAINALEAGEELTVQNAAAASRLHPRCGTSFLVIVILISVILMYPFIGLPSWQRIPLQVLFLFPVAGISFELLRLAGKYRNNPIANFFSQPGMWTQLLTTREPDESQVAVSLASLKAVMEAEAREAQRGVELESASEPAESVA